MKLRLTRVSAGFFLAVATGSLSLDVDSAVGRTWRVAADGTGDTEFIRAAMDSASLGDTVLVAPGEYEIPWVPVVDGVTLTSEAGPAQTRLVPDPNPGVPSTLSCSRHSATTIISGLWFDGFHSGSGLGAINIGQCADIQVLGCVFTNNEIGIAAISEFGMRISGNTFADNGLALNLTVAVGACSYNIIWDPAIGLQRLVAVCNDLLRIEDVAPIYRPINFSADPQFCASDDYYLAATSPCALGNSPIDCPLIGALPVNCTPTLIETKTWGQIKAMYQR